jgi:hypothetical protein
MQDHVIFGSEKGIITVVKPGAEYKQTSQMSLGEDLSTSPVIVNGQWFLRGKEHLFCIGN